jgi:hypothetical protein
MSGISLIIAGSRSVFPTVAEINAFIIDNFDARIREVVSGTADGGDRAGEAWAVSKGIPVRRMPAKWSEFGKIAGKMRNGEMAVVGDAALVLWDGISNGSADMVARMVERRKRVVVKLCEPVKKVSLQGALL